MTGGVRAAAVAVHPRLLVSLVFQRNDYHLDDHSNLRTQLLVPPVPASQAA